MLDYSEKRCYPRMDVTCPASYNLSDGNWTEAELINLSGGGLLIHLTHQIEPGTLLTVQVTPEHSLTPPMTAEVRALRCTALNGELGPYAVACEMHKVVA